jgi:hypothetical protein
LDAGLRLQGYFVTGQQVVDFLGQFLLSQVQDAQLL